MDPPFSDQYEKGRIMYPDRSASPLAAACGDLYHCEAMTKRYSMDDGSTSSRRCYGASEGRETSRCRAQDH